MSVESVEILKSPEVLELDLQSPAMTELFAKAEIYYLAKAGKYSKHSKVQARAAVPGETVTTVLENGTVETTNTAKEDQIVITNPGNEQYIIDADEFQRRYQPTEEEGVFQATGSVRAFQNQTGRPIQIIAPWGEPQYGDEQCMLATPYDTQNPDDIGTDRYIIGQEEFQETYGAPETLSTNI
ncbi:MAG TPA: PGDYG domain-containing protein [Candidatus Saccharimonadales bacterium]|nr:PGDYG domain-containing protein [Candidatus Saccharimonadales bacterium]